MVYLLTWSRVHNQRTILEQWRRVNYKRPVKGRGRIEKEMEPLCVAETCASVQQTNGTMKFVST